MQQKIEIHLGGLPKTLLLPLWGRAVETRKSKPRLSDPTAVTIVESIDYDFSTIARGINEVTQYAWIARCLHTDRTIRAFLRRHPKATIVNIGCGLDTTFERNDNGTLLWYDLDLPEVMALRGKFMRESVRRLLIPSSFLEPSWFPKIAIEDNILFIAGGVFYYFEEKHIKEFFLRLVEHFHGGEIFFDAASPFGVRVANQKVIRDGGMDENSILRWGIDKPEEIQRWDPRIRLLDVYPMFKGMKRGLDLKRLAGTILSDYYRVMSMVHYRL